MYLPATDACVQASGRGFDAVGLYPTGSNTVWESKGERESRRMPIAPEPKSRGR